MTFWDAQNYPACEHVALTLTKRYPDHFLAWKALGLTYLNSGLPAQSLHPLSHWARLLPDDIEARLNLGNACKDVGRLDDAAQCYREALRIQPDFAEIHSNLGNILRDLGKPTAALACYQEALRLKPGYAEAHSNLGNVLKDIGQFAAAEASYRAALRPKPNLSDAHSNLLFSQNYLSALPIDAAVAEARRYGQAVSSRGVPKFTAWSAEPDPVRLRIGFVSGNFVNHPVGYFAEALFAHLDREAFDLYAFTTSPATDELTERIWPLFHEWVPIFAMPDGAAAAAIHQRGIHVLIDLAGHSAGNRLPVFAFRPAPVQASWLGYFATTGLPEMDYFLGDSQLLPDDAEHEFTETVWRLPETWFCLGAPGEIPVAELPALANGHVTFGCFGNLTKMNDDVVALWASILREMPDARLFLKAPQLGDREVSAQVRDAFAAHGVAEARLTLEGYSPRRDYLSSYNRIDIVLDTFPYPGGTTSVEAMWMGVPVLTLAGDRFLGRLGASIAHNARQAQWIAHDRDDYCTKAREFASDLPALAALRAGLRTRLRATPLFDGARFGKHFGDTLRDIWRDSSLRNTQ